MAFGFNQSISFIYLLVILTRTTSLLLSHDEECLALFRFKQSIFHQDYASSDGAGGIQKFDSWRKITSNNTSDDNGSDCCLWYGVACSNEGHVIGLDLSQSSLRGPINSNSSLFKLVHLQMLNLSMNDFAGSQIPSEIGRLKQLRSLDLSKSRFGGQIPNEVSHLIQLSLLDLSWNPLKLRSPSLGNLLQNLTRLEELHFSGVDISSSVPRFLANFSSLKSIKLAECGIQDEFPSEIFHLPKLKLLSVPVNPNLTGSLPEFRNNTLLEELNLSSTSFTGIIPESISNLNHLVYLGLSQCYFSGHIPGSLSNLTQLTHLSLHFNHFTGPIPSLASLSKLIVLDLSDNQFEKGTLPDWICKLTNLSELYINRINLYDEILPSLANLSTLKIVSMTGNFIFGHIPSSFMNLTQLTVIDLGGNQLQGQISRSFSDFKSLKYLGLDHNNFSGRVDLDTFVELTKLETLYLSYNRISFFASNNYTDGTLPKLKSLGLSSCNLKEFPTFLRFQKKMTGLFLYYNKIEGLVPEWILNNSQETLHMIGLSHNFITGFHRHPHFLPWLRLEVFEISYNELRGQLPIPPYTTVVYDVSNNNLTGEIPTMICELKSLQVLDLSSNSMAGALPPCLGNLSNSLLVLDLKRNNFHGPVMTTFSHQSPLKRIDLSENRFSGQVLKSLANCTNLEFLSLGDNSFEDVFPLWLGALTELQVLILRSNKFYGAIQGVTSISTQFLNLRIIDVSNNSFSGQFPDKFFQTLNAMKSVYVGKSAAMGFEIPFNSVLPFDFPYSTTLTNKGVKTEYKKILSIFTAMDLSCNNFEGQIPHSLQDLHGLEFLNLSNNRLTGRILPSLGNLMNLESLDLSHNELSGEIPQQLLQLGFLAILNVSFNHLEGRIPQGKQFNTFENNSYIGNPGLYGERLYKKYQNSKTLTLPPSSSNESESESLLPNDIIDWIIIFTGFACGLVIGIVVGNILCARYSDWFIDKFGLRKGRRVRKLSNRKRNAARLNCIVFI